MPTYTVKDVSARDFNKAYSSHLKRTGKLPVPEWVDIVKTGVLKELAPYNPDWFYVRCASIARYLYINKKAGTGRLKKKYGGRQNNGSRPSHHADSSGSVARKALQALEKIGILEKHTKGGRRLSREGRRELDRIAVQVVKARTQENEEEA